MTGCLGTLGQPLVQTLRANGHVVYGLDIRHDSDSKFFRADIREARQVERIFNAVKPDVVYHLAAEFGRMNGEDYYEQLWGTNAIGTRNIIEACLKYNAYMVFASSSEAYGELDLLPGHKLYEDLLQSNVPLFHNEYALSKWANEKQVQIAINNRGLKATILRFFNAYGPGEHYHPYRSVVCLFIYRLLHGLPITLYKDYHRVFMYVDDWATTVARIADRYQYWANGLVLNIGGEEYTSVENMLEKLLHVIGPIPKPQVTVLSKEAANVTNKRPDNHLARVYLSHNPSTTLDVGLPRTVEWMRRQYVPTVSEVHAEFVR